MRQFVVTLVVAAILAVASLFPLARSAYAYPHGDGAWRWAGAYCTTDQGEFGILFYHTKSDAYVLPCLSSAAVRVLNAPTPLVVDARGALFSVARSAYAGGVCRPSSSGWGIRSVPPRLVSGG